MSDSLQPHGILQARILQWVAFPSGNLPKPGIELMSPALAGEFFTSWATVEAHWHWYMNIIQGKTYPLYSADTESLVQE